MPPIVTIGMLLSTLGSTISLRSAASTIYCVLSRNNRIQLLISPIKSSVARHYEPDLELQARRASTEVPQYPLSPNSYQRSRSSRDWDWRSGIPTSTPNATTLVSSCSPRSSPWLHLHPALQCTCTSALDHSCSSIITLYWMWMTKLIHPIVTESNGWLMHPWSFAHKSLISYRARTAINIPFQEWANADPSIDHQDCLTIWNSRVQSIVLCS